VLRTHLEFRVAITYEDGGVKEVFIVGPDGHPKIDVLYCMTNEEKEQAELAALDALELERSRIEAMEEDRHEK
jgi:hypothetical protein